MESGNTHNTDQQKKLSDQHLLNYGNLVCQIWIQSPCKLPRGSCKVSKRSPSTTFTSRKTITFSYPPTSTVNSFLVSEIYNHKIFITFLNWTIHQNKLEYNWHCPVKTKKNENVLKHWWTTRICRMDFQHSAWQILSGELHLWHWQTGTSSHKTLPQTTLLHLYHYWRNKQTKLGIWTKIQIYCWSHLINSINSNTRKYLQSQI